MKTQPLSTYRIQLNKQFTLTHLRAALPYLKELGISTIYASPLTAAFPGSNHGYDVINPDIINPEIGTEKDLCEIADFLKANDMDWLQDVVPNHMAYDASNIWLHDIMERGQDSPFYHFFDIDWNHSDPLLHGKLMAPFLGTDLSEAINKGEIELQWKPSGFVIAYFERCFPVAIDAYPGIFFVLNDPDDDLLNEIALLRDKKKENRKIWNESKSKFLQKINLDPRRTRQIQENLRGFNQQKNLLESLLSGQFIALCHAEMSNHVINYRRFFTVNSLICLHMEAQDVFEHYHRFIISLYGRKCIQGFRIDHIDGLYEPGVYLNRLRKAVGEDAYIVVEKIMQSEEAIPSEWAIEGTSGYDFLGWVNRLILERRGLEKIGKFYDELPERSRRFPDLVFDSKYEYMEKYMGGEIDNLFGLLKNSGLLAENDFDKEKLREAIRLVVAAFPIYRNYDVRDRIKNETVLRKTFLIARANGADLARELTFLQSLFDLPDHNERFGAARHFIKKLMQLTGPVAAKGVEDTVFYRYSRLISQNEVGDSPGISHFSVEDFHRAMQLRLLASPHTMNATSTHDTKRGEDHRIRLNTLTIFADEWISLVRAWNNINKPFISNRGSRRAPTREDEYFIYQSILGALPAAAEWTEDFNKRMHDFITKAIREADQQTSYLYPNTWYERNCHAFVDHILSADSEFLKTFLPFAKKIIGHAAIFSLSQLLIKLCAPGAPDFYQGSELWDLHLVDPDNRGAVDFDLRKKFLEKIIELEDQSLPCVLAYLDEIRLTGIQKLFVTKKALAIRNKLRGLFSCGEYVPVRFFQQPYLFSFIRSDDHDSVAVIIPLPDKPETSIEQITFIVPAELNGNWQNEFTGETICLRQHEVSTEIFAHFPVALLTKKI
jgi:(1->4)-alpha-D-glucan 1-alpha-D-glucosylmutase